MPAESKETAGPSPAVSGAIVWFRSTSGAEWEVAAGSPAYKRLLDDGAQLIDPPKTKD